MFKDIRNKEITINVGPGEDVEQAVTRYMKRKGFTHEVIKVGKGLFDQNVYYNNDYNQATFEINGDR